MLTDSLIFQTIHYKMGLQPQTDLERKRRFGVDADV